MIAKKQLRIANMQLKGVLQVCMETHKMNLPYLNGCLILSLEKFKIIAKKQLRIANMQLKGVLQVCMETHKMKMECLNGCLKLSLKLCMKKMCMKKEVLQKEEWVQVQGKMILLT